tara:strand:+ start:92 stop:2089 length:1998 start_codon:yes stop_codon:yes gene_type:complete
LNKNPPSDQLNSLINSFKEKNFQKAEEIALKITKNFSDHGLAWNILGLILESKNEFSKALNAYQSAIKTSQNDPNLFYLYFNLGNSLQSLNRTKEAIENYEESIKLKPNFFASYTNLAYAHHKLGNLNKAIMSYEKAIKLNNKSPETFNNLGNLHRQLGNFNESINNLLEAIKLNPNYAKAQNNIAKSYEKIGKLDEAILYYEKAVKIDPNLFDAEAHLIFTKKNICDFSISNKISNLCSKLGILTKSIPPFLALSWNDNPEQQMLRSKKYIYENFTNKSLKIPNFKYNNKKIKIAYFSADFYDFPSMHLMSGILEKHNRDFFEIYAFSYGPNNDDWMNKKIKSTVDHFYDVKNMPINKIIEITRKNKIDIVLDENCFTFNGRTELFQNRLAGIQINFLGYPGTSGANFIDYIVADKTVIPAYYKNFYTEKVIYMPHSYQPNDNLRKISSNGKTRKDYNLPENSFVLCCFNKTYKISSLEFNIWMKILKKINNSVLWLLKTNIWAMENLYNEAKKNGINPNRIIFAERVDHSEHLARHSLADLFVDTFNYNAHTTASDALWAGLPIVTKEGNQFSARVASSLLKSVNLNELITKNSDEYEKLILDLARHPTKLLERKKELSDCKEKKPLFDTERYTKNFENGLYQAYDLFMAGKKPKDIEVIDNL